MACHVVCVRACLFGAPVWRTILFGPTWRQGAEVHDVLGDLVAVASRESVGGVSGRSRCLGALCGSLAVAADLSACFADICRSRPRVDCRLKEN